MRRALELAERGRGRVAPNPLVGAVVVRDGRVVGEGWHAEFGAPHAEVEALEAAGAEARGATVYVGLEPCAHHGKTPPCTSALMEAGVERVVVGCRDPHDEAGGGAAELRQGGVRVEVGVEARAAARLNAPFLWRHRTDRPFVTLKLALSLDARIAARQGERTGVTGEEAREHAHRLRAEHDAVLVGRVTARVDDPRLTARGELRPRVPPVRVVLDSGLALPPTSRLVRTADEVPVWVACTDAADPSTADELEAAGVRVLELPAGPEGSVDVEALVDRLGREGLGSVLVEGGGRVAASFLRAGRVERMHLLYAPVLFGADGVEGFPGPLPTGTGWTTAERRALGDDTLLMLESRALREVLAEAAAPEDDGADGREGSAGAGPGGGAG